MNISLKAGLAIVGVVVALSAYLTHQGDVTSEKDEAKLSMCISRAETRLVVLRAHGEETSFEEGERKRCIDALRAGRGAAADPFAKKEVKK